MLQVFLALLCSPNKKLPIRLRRIGSESVFNETRACERLFGIAQSEQGIARH